MWNITLTDFNILGPCNRFYGLPSRQLFASDGAGPHMELRPRAAVGLIVDAETSCATAPRPSREGKSMEERKMVGLIGFTNNNGIVRDRIGIYLDRILSSGHFPEGKSAF
jgi:hypothetical protein